MKSKIYKISKHMKNKIKSAASILILMLNLSLNAQNLVPNPSFENYTTCPNNSNQLSGNTGNWYSSLFFTPDYFNACELGTTSFGVPHNIMGYQPAATGNGYGGFVCHYYDFPETREFISSQLSSNLSIGTRYFVSFKVSMAWNPSTGVTNACNNIGIRFSVDDLQATFPFQPNIAQIYSSNIINDTLGWTSISGSFIATDTSKYITIGNLFEDALTQVQALDQPGTGAAYYLIDDVCVSSDSLTCFGITVGLNQNTNSNKINIYPNPATDFITLDLPSTFMNSTYTLSVKNTMGQEVYQLKDEKQKLSLDTKSWGSKGVYFIEVSDGPKNQFIRSRIIIQ
jgi:hypothetical protein